MGDQVALSVCRECGGKVSTEAAACPHCGASAPAVAPPAASTVPRRAPTKPARPLSPRVRNAAILAAFGVLGFAVLSAAWIVHRADVAARDAYEKKIRDEAEIERVRQIGEARATEERARAAQQAAAARAKSLADLKARLAPMKPDERARELRSCIALGSCLPDDVSAIYASAATEQERTRLRRIAGAEEAMKAAASGVDGEHMSASTIAGVLFALEKAGTVETLREMPKTTLGAAAKDPGAARGSAIVVSGSVVEIRRSDAFYEGAIATDSMKIARFVTKLPTRGIEQGSWATFRGVFVQEYDYPNVSGGQTRSLLLAGAFDQD